MKLKLSQKTQITPTTPFDFDKTFFKPDHFTTGDNLWMPGVRWQTWNWQGQHLGLKFVNLGSVGRPKIEIGVYSIRKLSPEFVNLLIEEIKYRYNLSLSLFVFYKDFRNDSTLGPIIKRLFGMRPGHPSSLYEYLIIGVVLQNATVRRSIQMFKSLLERYGTPVEFDDQKLWCFWEPGRLRDVSEDEIRGLKVGYRARSIKRIDEQFACGLISEMDLRQRDRETQRIELLRLYGVGPATVWYLLFDVFHHWDYFDHISPWEQKIYSKIFFDNDPENPISVKKLLKYINKYGDHKHLAVHYIWEDLWWRRRSEDIPWLEKLVRV